MGLFSKGSVLATRPEHLDAAARALASGHRHKAIDVYGRWLSSHPDDHEVHVRVAPLHLQDGKRHFAWGHFRAAARGYAARGFLDKAIGVLTSAVQSIPETVEAWESIADLHVARGRPADALQALRVARASYARRRDRAHAARVLEHALRIDPTDTDVVVDLSRLQAKLGARAHAKQLLLDNLTYAEGADVRRVRKALFQLSPTPAALWRWLRA